MRRFKNILAVYRDEIGADNVFAQSVALARANDAKLTLIDVVPDQYAGRAGVKERKKRLQRLIPAIRAEGVSKAHVLLLEGTAFLEIIQQVMRGAHDLVVTCPEMSHSLQKFYVGSTTTHLVRKCPCPVWIAKPNQDGRYKRVLACIDPNSGNLEDGRLDQKILELATSLADTNGAEVHVLHAWDVEGPDRDRIRSEIPDQTRAGILTKHEAVHRSRVMTVLDAVPSLPIDYKTHMLRSAPHEAIMNTAANLGVDLIVMGSVNKTGISGFFIGSAAEAVLASSRCSLFTVKPEDFRSPVVLEQTPMRAAV
jgi:universal stress protein E